MGVDAVVVAAATGGNGPLLLAADVTRDRGAVVLVGAVPIELPRASLYDKELRFRVSRSYGPGRYDAEYEQRGLDYPIGYVRWTERRNMEAVLRLQAQGLVSFTDLIDIVPVQDAPSAYARLTGDARVSARPASVLAYAPADGAATHPAGTTIQLSATNGKHCSEAQRNGAGVAPARKVGTGRSPVGVGLIGPGGFANRVLVPELEAVGAKLVAVGGGAGPSAAAAARNGPFRRVAADASAVIADSEVEAVVIGTRHGSHAALVIEALQAGKHVFCEKPLALTSDELDAVMKAARAAPGTLLVGFNRRFSPLLREMSSFLGAPGTPMTVVYRVSAGSLTESHWTHDLVEGGGRALGEACHFVDSLSFLVGRPVVDVHASGHGVASRPVQAYDNLLVTLRFGDGSVASLIYVSDGSGRVPKERVEGFTGTRTAVLDDYLALDLYNAQRHDRRRAKTRDKGHRQEIAAFLRATRTGDPALSLGEIDNVTLATLAIVESLRTGRSVRLASGVSP